MLIGMDKIKICAWSGILLLALAPLLFIFSVFYLPLSLLLLIIFIACLIIFHLGFSFVGKKYKINPLKIIPIIFIAIFILAIICAFLFLAANAGKDNSLFGFPNFGLIAVFFGIGFIFVLIYYVYNLLISIFILRIKSVKIAKLTGIVGIISSSLAIIASVLILFSLFSLDIQSLMRYAGIIAWPINLLAIADSIIKIVFMFYAANDKASVSLRK